MDEMVYNREKERDRERIYIMYIYLYIYVYQKNTPNTYGARVGHDAGESAVPIIDVP
jgi:hypothetical protein